ncbi:MAG TPA: hypothetical protein VHY36_16150 [Steroidobacteraceae bacterium]|jgi:hypothetical protein|nr:hypothetical protein [Steroidobacteraceae bacterium]
MNASSKKLIRLLGPALVLLPLIAAAGDSPTPLIDQVRNATEQYLEISTAMAQNFVQATPCVSGPDTGAMGVHFIRMDRVAKLVLDARQPQALIYEPNADGAMRLVGVEYIVLDQNWSAVNPPGSAPALQGNLLNYVASPNRYGLPAFWEIHVWAWQGNPKGSYADWNTHVTCANQPLPRS